MRISPAAGSWQLSRHLSWQLFSELPLIGLMASRTTEIMPGRKFHYGWIVVGVTCVALLTAAGVRSTPGILMVPLEQEFHWSRATIAFSVSINLILYGCIGPFAAAPSWSGLESVAPWCARLFW